MVIGNLPPGDYWCLTPVLSRRQQRECSGRCWWSALVPYSAHDSDQACTDAGSNMHRGVSQTSS